MSLEAVSTPRFLRRTALAENEYNKNFLMTDREIALAVTSKEADEVTPLMSKIYLRLKLTPERYWERDGVLYFCAEDREGKPVKAWTAVCEVLGVASATASKALQWMHEVGVIGYFAGKNGVGIRIFLNRATSSIGVRPAPVKQKILHFSPASSPKTPASQNEPAFNDSFADLEVSDPDKSPAAPKPGATTENRSLRNVPTPTPEINSEALVNQILAAIEPFVTNVVNREGKVTFARIRDWLENYGIPKATRVAVHEGYKVAGRAGAKEEKQRRHEEWTSVGRAETAFEEPSRLSEQEVEAFARMCIELESKTGQLTETTLSELSAEAGGPILAEDAPRVRALIQNLTETPGKSAEVKQLPAQEDLEAAYERYREGALEERLHALKREDWEELVEAECEPFLMEKPSNRVFHGEILRKILESRVIDNLRATLNIKSYEEFIEGR